MKEFEERLKEQLSQLDQSPYNDTFEDGAWWCKEKDDSAYAGAYLSGIIAGVCLTILFQLLMKI